MRRIPALFVVAALTQVGATDCGTVIRDSGFDLWCGEELCSWKVERGEVKRVPTWNEGDYGVELVGPDTAIAQLTPVDSSDGYCRDNEDGGTTCEHPADACIEISMIANIDKTAAVELNIDISGDGTIDSSERLPVARWKPLSYRIVVARPFAGIRFQLAKSGTGTAQLANIGAELAKNCEGLPVLHQDSVPNGSPCLEDTDCGSGICGEHAALPPFGGVTGFLMPDQVCRGCEANSCGAGEICGLGDAASPVREAPTACVPIGSKQLGEQCAADRYDDGTGQWISECATGVCAMHQCSTCDPGGTRAGQQCGGGETCGPAWDTELGTAYGVGIAYVCSPHQHRRARGEPCANHDDCASNACNGPERRQCADGRQCGSPLQCPFTEGLQYGACSTVGIQGGTCQ